MITIATYNDLSEAYIAKGLLESSGINCDIKNANQEASDTQTSIALQVESSDSDEARKILEGVDHET